MWANDPNHRNDKILFRLQHEAIQHSDMVGSSRHAAAVVFKKRILSIGHNSRIKTHPIEKKFQNHSGITPLHAEKAAIIRAMNRYGDEILKDCDLYVLRVLKNGNIANSKPCPSCQEFIKVVKIKHTYWT
jgi:tRNA(Arg) A34 adenosine deaminase TadA